MPADVGAERFPTIREVHTDAEHGVFMLSGLVESIENAAPTLSHLERVLSAVQQLAKRHEPGVGLLIVIRDDAPPPTDEMRARIGRLFSNMESNLAAVAYVMEGEGFIAAAKRSVLTLIMASRRFRFPVKVFRDVGGGLPWLAAEVAPQDSSALTASRLVSEVQRVRADQYARRPSGDSK